MNRLLVVDDNEQNLYLLQALLAGHGYEVSVAAEGAEALEKARENPPDLIITDILMPGVDGYTLCYQWKRDEKLKAIPLVFYTATYTDPKDEELALSMGADRFILKPQEPDALLAIIEDVIEDRRSGRLASPREPMLEETTYFKQYNEVIIRKLEDKVFELESAKASLEHEITERELREQERATLEEQLRQAQKMEAVGRLAGGVAHDFNNMLQAILGYSYLALKEIGPENRLRSNLEQIQTAAERSADLTRQLLAFARKQNVSPKVLDLNETVSSMLKMLQRLIGEDIDLVWTHGSDLWKVRIDPSQVDQILANLCVNARDALEGVGKVAIETRNSVFDDAYCRNHIDFAPGEYVLLSVSDDGCGMDKKTLEQVFDPFFTTKGVGEGTGLGLATVYGIVKQNNGFINVYSELGMGTTFSIYFPRFVMGPGEVTKKCLTGPPKRGTETVLVVEDEESVLTLARRILTGLGYTVLATSSPNDAIRIVSERSEEIHLVITDVVMPEMNGRQLVERLSSIRPGMKQLFMSGYTANVIAHRGIIDEGVLFVQKPFSVETLAAKVREALDAPCLPTLT